MQPGVNLVGFLEAESGLGEIARRLGGAIERAEVPLVAISFRGTLGRQDHQLPVGEAAYDTNLICLNPDNLTAFATEVGSGFFARRYSIGVWFWETSVLRPEERAATRFLDELWVASEYVRSAIEVDVDIPVHVVPVPMVPLRGPFRTRSELDLPDGFTFLYLFDFWSGERKNPTAVLEAFVRAFAPGEGPTLILKSINGREWEPEQLERLTAIADGRADVLIRDGYVSAAERDSYVAACDCYVSLHRSEGLGLTMAEAMACGKPVIATGYSGNLAFMTEENSYLVPYRLVDVPDTWWAHAPGARWAEPDGDSASRFMRRVWEHSEEARARGSRARDELLARLSYAKASAFVEARLGDARARGAVTARTSLYDARPSILDASRELASEVSARWSLGRGSRPASLVRRLLGRALWPYFEERRRFEKCVVEALIELQRSVDDLERRACQLESRSSRVRHESADARTEGSMEVRST